MDFVHVRSSVSQPCLTDAVIVILNGLLSYEHPSNGRGFVAAMTKSRTHCEVCAAFCGLAGVTVPRCPMPQAGSARGTGTGPRPFSAQTASGFLRCAG